MVQKKYEITNLVGQTFNRVTITGEVKEPGKDRQFTYLCICGRNGKATPYHIVNSVVKSCGCLLSETAAENGKSTATHGMYGTRPYRIWQGMKTRCDNPNVAEYSDYGGRGITYDKKWSTFQGFWEDMEEGYFDHLTLDRVNNNEGYAATNCRWVDMSTQGHNRRKHKGSLCESVGVKVRTNNYEAAFCKNGVVQYLGKYLTEYEAAKAYDDAYETVYGTRRNKTTKDT